jgi:hypothetical protein
MNVPPPPKPAAKKGALLTALLCAVGFVLLVCGILLIHYISTPGIDNVFGDQHLKTAVALIELHKVRYGEYPASLSDLKFTGQWDQIALRSVRYYPNAGRTAYYLEVERGWIGKPDLKMPEEFWRGTGYSLSFKPKH